MAKRWLLLIVLALLYTASGKAAWAQARVALVIGNSTYQNISSLKNARSDAALMASTLRGLDFDVVEALDVDRVDMAKAMRAFGQKLREAGKDAVGLFYYAGHGVQVRGVNYMVPTTATIDSEVDLEVEALSADNVLSQMRDAGNATSIIILDACRNNPFATQTRSATRGLARVSASGGAIVAFSAAPGQVAADGEGENSPYTTALARAMQQNGLSIEQVFKRVLVDVENATGGEQVPWVESSLRDDFYFRPTLAAFTPGTDLAAPAAMPEDAQAWASIRAGGDVEALEKFIQRHPESLFADLARLRLETLRGENDAAATPPAKEPQLAALTPPSSEPSGPGAIDTMTASPDGTALHFALQTELGRIGCIAGKADGVWGRKSDAALALFQRHASRSLPPLAPDARTLALLKDFDGRICPLSCAPTEQEIDGACVRKSCPSGQALSSKGVCYASAPKPTKPKTGRNCWTLIDEVICE